MQSQWRCPERSARPQPPTLSSQPCSRWQRSVGTSGRKLLMLQVRASDSARPFDAGADESGSAAQLDVDMKQQTARLSLLWKLQSRRLRKPEPCNCCQGSGERECSWCHGAGVMMLGDSLVCSTSEHHCKCPVCNAMGYLPCANCRGTGFRAKWLGGNTTCEL